MKSIDSTRWQLIKLGTTVPLKPGDICSLVPDKCWFKVLAVVNTMESNGGTPVKRKVDDTESTHTKRFCSDSGEGDNLHPNLCRTLRKTINDNNAINDAIEITVYNLLPDKGDDKIQEANGNSVDSTMQIEETQPSILEGIELSANGMKSPHGQETSNLHLSSLDNGEDTRPSIPENRQPDESLSSVETGVRREKCKYGKDCYRRNPQHKADFSHVGDSDYDMPDDREECPYGTRCYRTNPEHRQQFKHTVMNKRNNKQNRKPSRVQASSNDFTDVDLSEEESIDESIDESDYEPSTDFDSDYEQCDESSYE